MKRELITAALILACVVASYQAFKVETPAMEQVSGPVTLRSKQKMDF
jgi:hypothetical protein